MGSRSTAMWIMASAAGIASLVLLEVPARQHVFILILVFGTTAVANLWRRPKAAPLAADAEVSNEENIATSLNHLHSHNSVEPLSESEARSWLNRLLAVQQREAGAAPTNFDASNKE